MSDYQYKAQSHPKFWPRTKRRNPRWFWFQQTFKDGRVVNLRKNMSFENTFRFGDLMMGNTPEIECLFLIDGNLPKDQLAWPPIEAVWNRWELGTFVEDGKPCHMVLVDGMNVFDMGRGKVG